MGRDGKLVRPGILLSTATDSLAPQIAFLPVHGDTSRWVIASKSVDFPRFDHRGFDSNRRDAALPNSYLFESKQSV